MRKSKILLKLFVVVLLYSCVQQKEKNVEELEESKTNVTLPIIQDNDWSAENLLDENIDTQKIKSQLDNVTTTFLSKEDVMIFPDRKRNNFYGHYTLIKNDEGGTPTKRVGNMIIYDSINPYKYEKDTDEFVEITLNEKGVSLFNEKLEVGVTKYSTLLKEFGNDFQTRNNTLIFIKDNKMAFFKIKDSIVSKIKLGQYRDDADLNKILRSW